MASYQLILIGVIISFLASRIGRAMGVSNEANVFNAVGTLVTTVGFLLEFVSILAMLLPVLFVAIVPFLSVKDEYLGYKALARVPEFASTSDLIAALKTKSSKMREATADTLKKRGQAIVPELVEALQSGDEALSSLVIEILDAIDPNWKSNS